MKLRALMLTSIAGALALVLAFADADARRYDKRKKSKAGVFDYYSLVLSWSPTFCDSNAGRRARQQCGLNRRYAFVVHGLWPQHEKGWPQNCRVKKGEFYIRKNIIDSHAGYHALQSVSSSMSGKNTAPAQGLSNKDYFAITTAAL